MKPKRASRRASSRYAATDEANKIKLAKEKQIMSDIYQIEITDTFAGEANYSWVKRDRITMPELTHYGFDGSQGYVKANKTFTRELVKKVKALAGWTGARCEVTHYGDTIEIRPRNACMIAFVTYSE